MDKVNYEVANSNIFIKSLNIEHIKYMLTDNNVRIILILMTFQIILCHCNNNVLLLL